MQIEKCHNLHLCHSLASHVNKEPCNTEPHFRLNNTELKKNDQPSSPEISDGPAVPSSRLPTAPHAWP